MAKRNSNQHKKAGHKIIHRYIFWEIVPTFIASLFVFTFVLLIDKILNLTELVINKGVPLGSVLKLFAYVTPSILVITVPMAMFIAILFAFARFSSDSEVIAMKSCGISLYNMLPPVMAFATTMYVISSILMLFLLPQGNKLFKKNVYDIVKNRLNIGIKERIFNDDFKNIVIYANKVDDATGELNNIMISDTRDKDESHTIIARSGRLVTGKDVTGKDDMRAEFVLKNGSIHKKIGDEEYHLVNFDDYRLNLSMGNVAEQGDIGKNERELTLAELKERIRVIDSAGANSRDERVELHKRFSLPFACIVFGIIASPLGIFSRRSGKTKGFTYGLFIILIYYVLLTFGEALGKRGALPAPVGIWMPNIILGGAGVYLFVKSAKESPIMLIEFINRIYEDIERFIRNKVKKIF